MMPGFIMAGRIQATIFVIVSTLISLLMPPMIVFSNAAIALITLRKGWQQGLFFTLLATATLMIVSVLLKQSIGSGLVAGLVTWLPMLLIASALAISNSWGKTLQFVLLLAIAGILLFHFLHPDVNGFWIQLLDQVKPILKKSYQLSDAELNKIISNASHWMTGTSAAVLTLIAIISLIIARNWQALLYNPGGFGEEFRQIRLGKQTAIGLLIAIVLVVISNNPVITELIIAAIAIFMFQGLSLAHDLVKRRGLGGGWLVALYVLTFLMLIQMIVLLAAFGVIDNFVDFRRKFTSTK